MAWGCRPTRHWIKRSQIKLTTTANAKLIMLKLFTKPGTSFATFNAGCAGTPVCKDTQTPQMINAPPVKKNSVNQSIRAATARLKVGSENAANAAMPGNAKSSVRSGSLVNKLATSVTTNMNEGHVKC